MTTILTQAQTDALRSIGDSAIVLWAFYLFDRNFPGRAAKPNELLQCLYPVRKDIRKLNTELDALCASGRLAKQGLGYVLLEGGRALVLSINNSTPEGFEIGRKDLALSPDVSGAIVEAQALNEENVTRKMRALVVEEEDISLFNKTVKDSSTATTVIAENAQDEFPSVRMILRNTTLVFDGSEVITKDLQLDVIDPAEALAVIAHCFALRRTDDNPSGVLNKPAGVAYSMLRDGRRARTEFRLDPVAHLPEAYLEALGLAVYTCDVCQQTFKTKAEHLSHDGMLLACKYACGRRFHSEADQANHYQADHLEAISSEYQSISFEKLAEDHKAVKLWNLVKSALQTDMPRASFDTWVSDTTPTSLEDNLITIAARNAYTKDWLTDRLTSKIEVMLKNFTHETIKVRFVVGVVDVEEADASE